MALYRANAPVRSDAGPAACGIIACSSEVIGPDSFASTEIVPVRAATISAGSDLVRANTAPARPITTKRAA